MELWVIWVLAGFALVIAELLTGTFYLLVIAAGAFAAAAAASLGSNALVQAVVGSAVGLGGAWFVHHWHLRNRGPNQGKGSNFLDRGQSVVLEAWVNEGEGIARVKYRGTSWDARYGTADTRPPPGSTLYIDAMDGNLLVVVPAPPAR
jgi:membrane protein implicated in regulation of membrane protease activity